VVGVAANGKYRRMTYDSAPLVLLPLMQRYASQVILHVRVNGDPQSFASSVERTVHGLNADLPLFNEDTLKDDIKMGSVFERIAAAFGARSIAGPDSCGGWNLWRGGLHHAAAHA